MANPVPDISYYDTGAVRYRGFRLDGEMHGEWEFLRKDGSVMRTGSFDRGSQPTLASAFNGGRRTRIPGCRR